jgi:PTS system nitrogen regulatory IIA component
MVMIEPVAGGRDDLFRRFGERFAEVGLVRDADQVTRRLLEREEILSTGIGGGVAVPHAQIPGLGRVAMAASVHRAGLDYPSADSKPVRLVFCLLGDTGTAADHLAGLARLARLARRTEALERLIAAGSGDEFVAVLATCEDS